MEASEVTTTTAQYMPADDAMRGLMRDLASIDEDEVTAVVLIAIEHGELAMNSIGDIHAVHTALTQAIAKIEEMIGAPN